MLATLTMYTVWFSFVNHQKNGLSFFFNISGFIMQLWARLQINERDSFMSILDFLKMFLQCDNLVFKVFLSGLLLKVYITLYVNNTI